MYQDASEQNEQSIILEQATYTNSYSVFVPWANSIAFKVNSFRYQEQRTSMRIAEDFLANLGFVRDDLENEASIQTYFSSIGTAMLSFASLEDNAQFKKIKLPVPTPLKMSLENLIKSRRSQRQYTGDSISLQYTASIIKAAMGITTTNEVSIGVNASTSMSYRAVPSAGGLFPIELTLVALNVDELEKGIYQYNPSEDSLVKLHDSASVDALLECFSVPEELISIQRAGFICLLIGSAPKAMYKYGNRGLGFTLHEVGGISQNIHLAVTSLGLGSVDCAGYFNNEAHQVLKLDGIYKHLFHTIVIGVSQ